jgi:hypothetical protein
MQNKKCILNYHDIDGEINRAWDESRALSSAHVTCFESTFASRSVGC